MASRKAKKSYRVPADPIAYVKMGGAIATDRITVDGEPVGYMRRDVPSEQADSGWSFFAGDETKRYLADMSKRAVWHMNDIADMDPSIVPWLYALPGSAFERDGASGDFVETRESKPDPAAANLPEGVSVVQGEVTVGDGWTARLPTPFRRRIEDGSLVLWRPGLTFWIASGSPKHAPEVPEDAKNVVHGGSDDGAKSLVFERAPEREDGAAVVVAYLDQGALRVFMRAYYDRAPDGEAARAILAAIHPRTQSIP